MKKNNLSLGLVATGFLMSSSMSFANDMEGVVTASALNVRENPTTDSSVLTKVYKGEVVKIIESQNNWCKIQTSSGKIGFVSASYLNITQNFEKVNSSNENQVATINVDALNLRSGAGTDYSVVKVLVKNEQFEILESQKGWSKIKTTDGQVGFIASQYIIFTNNVKTEEVIRTEEVKEESKDENITEINKEGIITASSLNLRSGTGTSHSVIDKLKRNEVVLVLESKDGWYKIQTSSGKIGFASANYIDLDYQEESVQIEEKISKVESSVSNNEKINNIVKLAKEQIGKPYLWGSTGPSSFDCSGLVYYVFKEACDISLPRTSKEQYTVGKSVDKQDLAVGDLVFSSSRADKVITHVGIYIGNNQMIHSPKAGKNVQISDMSQNYWQNSYVGAKRIL